MFAFSCRQRSPGRAAISLRLVGVQTSDLGALARCAIASAALFLAGCGPDVAQWQEEVRLSDGKVIVLERKSIIGPGSPVEHRGAVISHELCYKPMGVYLKTGGVFQPEIFDLVDGIPYIALPVRGCALCQLDKYPEHSTLFFEFVEGAWRRIPYSAFPRQADTNLLQRIFSGRNRSRDIQGYVSLDGKRKHDGDPLDRGGTFKKWMHGQRGSTCSRCAVGPTGTISGPIPDSWLPILENGKRC